MIQVIYGKKGSGKTKRILDMANHMVDTQHGDVVFVDAEADDRLIRVISRDCIERGRTPNMVIERYERVLKPMHNLHIEPAKKFADIIVPQGGHNEVAINLLTDYIKSRLNSKK